MSRAWKFGIGAALVMALALVLVWREFRSDAASDQDPVAMAAAGETLYVVHCAQCHGGALEGQPNWRERKPDGRLPAPPHDHTGHTWHHPDEQLFAITKHGLGPLAPAGYISDMPAYEKVLSDQQIRAVLAFIKSRWPEEIRARQAETTRRAGG